MRRPAILADPPHACVSGLLSNHHMLSKAVVVIVGGGCLYEDKGMVSHVE